MVVAIPSLDSIAHETPESPNPPLVLSWVSVFSGLRPGVVLESEFPPIVQFPGISHTTVKKMIGKVGVSKK